MLGELPGPWQLVGGVVILGGIVAVRLGERSREYRHVPPSTPHATDDDRTLEPLGGP